ncbi:MAG: globin domain-containing protein [Polyangiales bacterium]
MLSDVSRPYIQASVPVLREHGQTIAREFYQQLFAAQPDLKNLFNLGNQASGAQQTALAAAVFAYAANFDDAEALAPVLRRIAHKHASVGVKPAHYPIVGRHLLAAIQTVLGSAATPELLAAWDEAYGLLAQQLIAAESELYRQASIDPGTFRSLVVSKVERENDSVRSFYLQTESGESPGSFEPGQYVSVAVQIPEPGVRQLRQYSLSDTPQRPYWRITVKAEPGTPHTPDGMVSNYLHQQVQAGDRLAISAPFGDFTPLITTDPARPLALLSAGAGITPLMSVLNTLAGQSGDRPVLFAHAARDPSQPLFAHDLLQARASLPGLQVMTFYNLPDDAKRNTDDSGGVPATLGEQRSGRMQLGATTLRAFANAQFYLSGPIRFVQDQWRSLIALGVSARDIEREVFGPELLDHLA